MISKIDIRTKRSAYILNLKSNVSAGNFTPTSISQKNVSFTGIGSTARKSSLKLLEGIKSKIPNSVIVISGPSGVGKDTIINAIRQRIPQSKIAVSYTTRAMRAGEAEGVNYHFISRQKFDEMNSRGAFFNQNHLNGNSYGGTYEEIDSKRLGKIVIYNMSADEAHKIKAKYGEDAVLIFIAPPSLKALEERLMKRGSETLDSIRTRLQSADKELHYRDSFDCVILNDNLKTAVNEAEAYINERRPLMLKIVDAAIEYLSKKD